jgi:hypothetical protein
MKFGELMSPFQRYQPYVNRHSLTTPDLHVVVSMRVGVRATHAICWSGG